MPLRYFIALICSLPWLWVLSACKSNMLTGMKSPQESYGDKLKRTGLDSSAMGIRWFAAAERSLVNPLTISIPFREAGFFSPDNPVAFGYRINMMQGQKLTVSIRSRSDLPARIFMELWKPKNNGSGLELIKYADSTGVLTYEADANTSLVLRLQTELLAPVSYDLEATVGPSLAFPVQGGGNNNIGSSWGDQRDAGARKHEGIDIFGKRGTPILAAAEGRITSVRTGGLGGKTVWLRPRGKDINLYYAHLDSQMVEAGQQVNTGDTVGLLGNTGNAINTAPHLHFGVYGNAGALDPIWFVRKETNKSATITGNMEWLGKAARTASKQTLLVETGNKSGSRMLDKSTYLVITGAIGNFYKVLLPDKSEGFLPVNAVSSLDRNIENISSPKPSPLLFAPVAGSAIVASNAPSGLQVKARFNDFVYVENGTVRGWMLIR